MSSTTYRVVFAILVLAYFRNFVRTFHQHCTLLLRNEPRLTWSKNILAALKYTSIGQLVAGCEYLLCFEKHRLAARIGRSLVCRPRNCSVNCRYGPYDRNVLDIYGVQGRKQTIAAKPVLVFIHGGAWSFGHKWQYALVGEYLALQGILVAVMAYRTYPNGSIVDMVEDVENAVLWVAQNCDSLGGDSNKLFLCGHSAGGHIGALALVNSAIRLVANDPTCTKVKEIACCVQGFIGLSAPYDISDHYVFESERSVGPFNGVHNISPMKPAMLGINNFKNVSPTALVAGTRHPFNVLPPFYILHGKNDTAVPMKSSRKFALALRQAGHNAMFREVSKCTHQDILFALMGDSVDCRMEVLNLLQQILSGAEKLAFDGIQALPFKP